MAPLNVLSGFTDTRFQMVRSEASHATKRLLSCEFAPAFAARAYTHSSWIATHGR